jgi:four helix bundle protein
VQRFTDLQIWQRSHQLALDVYRLTASFPRSERFGLGSQTRRAVVSVSSNIAEGAKRLSQPDYARFLNVAEGSLAEVESLLRLARDLEFAPAALADGLIDESEQVPRMIHAMRERVRGRGTDG